MANTAGKHWDVLKDNCYFWLLTLSGMIRMGLKSYASFRHVVLNQERGNAMSKIVRYELDPDNLPTLTDAQKAELKALSEMPDSAIDVSDIPTLDNSFWKNAVENPFYKPTKTSTTVRVDSDVLAWLKAQGKGYQTRINAILRKAMLDDLKGSH